MCLLQNLWLKIRHFVKMPLECAGLQILKQKKNHTCKKKLFILL